MSGHEHDRIEPTHEETLISILAAIESRLDQIFDELRFASEWGAVDTILVVPVKAAGPPSDVNMRGNFRSVVIINETANAVSVGFAPGAGITGREGSIELPANCYMVIPVRGVTISLGAKADGNVVVIPLAVVQSFSAGKLA